MMSLNLALQSKKAENRLQKNDIFAKLSKHNDEHEERKVTKENFQDAAVAGDLLWLILRTLKDNKGNEMAGRSELTKEKHQAATEHEATVLKDPY